MRIIAAARAANTPNGDFPATGGIGTFSRPCGYFASPGEATQEEVMGRGLLLWLIGIPLPIILLIWVLGGLHG
jgi:hypothetical protein